MKLINKNKRIKNGYKETRIYFCNILIWFEKKSFLWRTLKLCGITVLSYRNKLSTYRHEKVLNDATEFINYSQNNLINNKKAILWIDHSLGGGTETYSFNQFKEMEGEYNILRLQYNPGYNCFIFTIPQKTVIYVSSFESVKSIVCNFKFSEICINNVVGWFNISDLLTFISCYKKEHITTKISFRGHDFQCLCPSYNLLNCDNVFCNLSYKAGCTNCIKNVKLSKNKNENKILFSGFKDIEEWRNVWEIFFTNTLDEVIVFSDSTKELFIKIYPVLRKKIRIVPHKVQSLPKIAIKKHNGINVAMLGNMNSIAKGYNIIKTMCKENKDSCLRFIVLGSYKKPPKGLIVTGQYKPSDIPALIKKYSIDLIFISSIWPETFSYTTSEAISMDIPVACYNIGDKRNVSRDTKKGLFWIKLIQQIICQK